MIWWPNLNVQHLHAWRDVWFDLLPNVVTHVTGHIDWSIPSDTYITQKIGPCFVQVMLCQRFGTKPLSEPFFICSVLLGWMVIYFWNYNNLHSGKWIWKCCVKIVAFFCIFINVFHWWLISNVWVKIDFLSFIFRPGFFLGERQEEPFAAIGEESDGPFIQLIEHCKIMSLSSLLN